MEKLSFFGPRLNFTSQTTRFVTECFRRQRFASLVAEKKFEPLGHVPIDALNKVSRVFYLNAFGFATNRDEITLCIFLQAAGEKASSGLMTDFFVVGHPSSISRECYNFVIYKFRSV